MNPVSRRPLPPELRDELSQRTEGHELAQVWELLAIADPVPGSPEAEQVWERISADIARGRPILTPSGPVPAVRPAAMRTTGSHRAIPSIASRRRSVVPWALAATLVAAVGLGTWQARPITVHAPLGEQVTVTLPDGSTAELNAGSSLQYARGFRRLAGLAPGARAVTLDGEAYFSVVSGNRPFAVATEEARVTVLGTKFVVRAHRSETEGTRVAVESGRVRVQGVEDAGGVELGAGQGTVVPRGGRAPMAAATVVVDRLTLWRRGGLAFVDQPLDAIFRELERRYAVTIRLRNVVIGDERLAVYYSERPSIETVLNDLCTMAELRYSRTSRGFEITPQAETPRAEP